MDNIHEVCQSRYEHNSLATRTVRLVEVVVLVDLVVLQITAIDQLGRQAASAVESVDITLHFIDIYVFCSILI